jgi:hypothetical protein
MSPASPRDPGRRTVRRQMKGRPATAVRAPQASPASRGGTAPVRAPVMSRPGRSSGPPTWPPRPFRTTTFRCSADDSWMPAALKSGGVRTSRATGNEQDSARDWRCHDDCTDRFRRSSMDPRPVDIAAAVNPPTYYLAMVSFDTGRAVTRGSRAVLGSTKARLADQPGRGCVALARSASRRR